MRVQPNYLELTVNDLAAARAFYENAFGFSFTSYGPNYAAVEGGPVELGLRAAPVVPPLPVWESKNLEEDLAHVRRAGGVIVREIEAYPGGRRFHAKDPAGNEFAIYQKA